MVAIQSATRGHEIVVTVKNDIGVLFELSALIANEDVSILAVSGAVWGEDSVIRLVIDDVQKAKHALAETKFHPEEESVVLVELSHRPGMLKQITKTLAQAGIDLRHVYAASAKDQDQCLLVFHSSNDEEALARLKEMEGQ
jgi:hypothetical protein